VTTRATSRPNESRHPSVGIVGAGIAGLTAALRLAERGFRVTVYERNVYAGGLLSAHTHGDGVYHEHCYHMFLNWYHNFWNLVDDIGLSRERDFEPRQIIRYMRPGGSDSFALSNPGAPEHLIDNVFSGVAPPADVFLSAYSLIDLLTQQFRPGRLLDQYSVNSFMQSRPYASEQSALLHQYLLAKAFAVPSYLTSAASYKQFVKYSFRLPDPLLWVLRADAEQGFMRPLIDRLTNLGCQIRLGCDVTEVNAHLRNDPDGDHTEYVALTFKVVEPPRECYVGAEAPMEKGRAVPSELNNNSRLVPAPWAPPLELTGGRQRHDYVILAVPPAALQRLIAPKSLGVLDVPPESFAPSLGAAARRRIKAPAKARAALRLPRVAKLKSEPMAALDLYFTRRLTEVPREHVVLLGSDYGLTFIDTSQVWPSEKNEGTVLNVIASDYKALANLEPLDAVYAILEELNHCIPFDETDIDWSKLHLQTNVGDKLFINEVGSESYRPGPTTDTPNLFLAGDYCKTPIDVVTVEAAVVSGLQASRALQVQAVLDGCCALGDQRARPIEIVEPQSYPDAQLMMLKLILFPYACAAKGWSWLNEQISTPGTMAPDSAAWSRLLSAAPGAAAAWWRTAWDLWVDAAGVFYDDR
jgi:uncharacterized protein with NAD-binding domain and iron-sulfur cluster